MLVAGADPASPSGTTGPPTSVLTTALTGLGFTATALSTGTAPSQATIDGAVAAARGKDAVAVGTHNVTAGSVQRTLVDALVVTGVPVVAISVPVVAIAVRNPYAWPNSLAWAPTWRRTPERTSNCGPRYG